MENRVIKLQKAASLFLSAAVQLLPAHVPPLWPQLTFCSFFFTDNLSSALSPHFTSLQLFDEKRFWKPQICSHLYNVDICANMSYHIHVYMFPTWLLPPDERTEVELQARRLPSHWPQFKTRFNICKCYTTGPQLCLHSHHFLLFPSSSTSSPSYPYPPYSNSSHDALHELCDFQPAVWLSVVKPVLYSHISV